MKRTKGKGGGGSAFPSECSGGCESGWTMYLENQSFGRKPATSSSSKQPGRLPFQTADDGISQRVEDGEELQVEEEDLSMLSDASSGPPHILGYDDCFDESGYFWAASYSSSAALAKKSSKRKQMQDRDKQQHHSLLDDTASSHVFSFSKKSIGEASNKHSAREDVLEFSVGFSATHFKDCSEEGWNYIF